MKVSYNITWFPWLCWLSAAFLYLFQYGLFAMPAAFQVPLKHDLMMSSTEMGFFTSAFLYSYVIMQIPAGLLLDRFGARYTVLFSMCTVLIGILVLFFAQNFTEAFISRLLIGFGGGAAFVCAVYLGRTWLPVTLFPIVIGLTEAMCSVGENCAMLFAAILLEWQSWRIITLEMGGIGLLLLLMIIFCTKDKKHYLYAQQEQEKKYYGLILRDSRLWLVSIVTGCNFAHFLALASFWRVSFLMMQDNLTNVEAVSINSLVLMGFTIGCPLFGVLAKFISTRKLLLFGTFIELIALVISQYTSMDALRDWMLLTLGVATGNVLLSFALIREFTPMQAYGFCSGFLNMFFGLLGLICLPLIGYILEKSHHNITLAGLPIVIANSIALLLFIAYLYQEVRIKRKEQTRKRLSE